MTSIFQQNLRNVKAWLLDRGWDYVVCYDGFERVGKSTLALQAAMEIDPSLVRDIECGDFRRALQHTSHSQSDMVKRVRDGPDNSAHHLDEASLLAREAMAPWNIQMMKSLSVMGYKHDFVSFNFPNFWDLDPYLRDHRCASRILVRSYMGERGRASCFVARKADFPRAGGRKIWWDDGFDIEFTGFDEWSEPYQEFWARYEKEDRKAKEQILGGSYDPELGLVLRMRNKLKYQWKDIAEVLDRSSRHLRRKVRMWESRGFTFQ